MTVFEMSFKAMLVLFAIYTLCGVLYRPFNENLYVGVTGGACFVGAFIFLIISILTFGTH